jgi:hypothetical protein
MWIWIQTVLLYVNSIKIRKQNIDRMNAITVHSETNNKAEKGQARKWFYNIIDAERVSAGKTLSVVNLLPESVYL